METLFVVLELLGFVIDAIELVHCFISAIDISMHALMYRFRV